MSASLKYPEDQVPEDFLDQNFAERSTPLNHWLSRFVVEVRRQDGENYPPATLHSLLAGILCYMREQNPDTPDFLSKKDWRKGLRGAMESALVELQQKGVGAEVKRTEVITQEE